MISRKMYLDGGDINEGKKRKKETERTRWRIVTESVSFN